MATTRTSTKEVIFSSMNLDPFCNAIHLIGIDVSEQDLISDNDGHDGIASNHGDKDDAVDLVVLVDGDIGVTMLLHNVEAGPDDLPAVLSLIHI